MSFKFSEIKKKVGLLLQEKDTILSDDEFRLAVIFLLKKILDKP